MTTSAASAIIALTTSLASVAALAPGRQIVVAGASSDFVVDVYAANAVGATSFYKLGRISNGQTRTFSNDSSTIMKYVVVTGSLGSGHIWVQGDLGNGSSEVDLSGSTGQTPVTGVDVSTLGSGRQLIVTGPALRISIYVGNSASGSFALLKTVQSTTAGISVPLGSDQSAFMKYTVDSGTPTTATTVFVTGATSPASIFRARAVATSIGANTVSDQILTITATGALAAQDGVTVVAGDTLLFPAGLSNVTTGQAGPWTTLQLGDTTTSAKFARPSWWQNGQPIPGTNTAIRVAGAGTLFPMTTWRNANGAGTTVIGTDEPQLFPDMTVQVVTLSTGTIAVTNVPIYSATKSSIRFERTTPNTTTATVMYCQSAITAGPLGTATVTIQAQTTTGAINTADVSTGRLVIQNFA